jgi:hypothetical protein
MWRVFYAIGLMSLISIILNCAMYKTELIRNQQQPVSFYRVHLEDRGALSQTDAQNVHNLGVERGVDLAICRLQDSLSETNASTPTPIPNLPDFLAKHDALKSYQIIKNVKSKFHNLDEIEIINLVWTRIHHPINNNNCSRLKEEFIQQLRDTSINDSDLVCVDGRIARILQTLEFDADPNLLSLRPVWAFREEISERICQYRRRLMEKLPAIYQRLETTASDEMTCDDFDRLDQFNLCLIKNLEIKFHKDYVKPALLTTDELNQLTRDYYDALYCE